MLHGMVQLVNIMALVCGSYAGFLLHIVHQMLGRLELRDMEWVAPIRIGMEEMKAQKGTG